MTLKIAFHIFIKIQLQNFIIRFLFATARNINFIIYDYHNVLYAHNFVYYTVCIIYLKCKIN